MSSCNLLLIGKSGAGKSSFGNYLLKDKELFATGKGAPVTGWADHFKSYSTTFNGMNVEVLDSKGELTFSFCGWGTIFSRWCDASRNCSTSCHRKAC